MSTRAASQEDNASKKKVRTAQEERRRQSNLKSQRNWRLKKEKYLKDLEETVVELEAQNDILLRESTTLKSIMSRLLKSPQMPPEMAQAIWKTLNKEKILLTSNVTSTLPRMTEAVLQNHGGKLVSNRIGTPTVVPAVSTKSATPESGYGSVESPDPVDMAGIVPTIPTLPQFNFGNTTAVGQVPLVQNLDQLLASISVQNTGGMTWSPAPVRTDSFASSSNGSYRDPIADLTGEPSASPPTLAQMLDTNSLALLSALLPQTTEDTAFWKGVDQIQGVALPTQPISPPISNEDSTQSAADTLGFPEEDIGLWTNFDDDMPEEAPPGDLPTLNTEQLGGLRVGKEYQQSVKQLRPLAVRMTAGMIRLLFEIDLDRVPCSLLKGKLRLMRIRFNDAWQIIKEREAAGMHVDKDEMYREEFHGEHVEELCDLFKTAKCADGTDPDCNPEQMQNVTESVISALSAVKTVQDYNLSGDVAQKALENLEKAIDRCPNSHTEVL